MAAGPTIREDSGQRISLAGDADDGEDNDGDGVDNDRLGVLGVDWRHNSGSSFSCMVLRVRSGKDVASRGRGLGQ